MEEIKVGEYVRTELGDIKKITEGFEFIIERYNKSENKIVNHSPNIIDLIEEGDYVNGKEVIWNSKTIVHCDTLDTIDYTANEIKSICTKEQFENISYKVEV